MQPKLRDYVTRLLDTHLTRPMVDLANDIVFPTTLFAGFALLGFPIEDVDRIKRWCGQRVALMFGDLTDEQQVENAQYLIHFWNYCRTFVRMRLDNPGDDLTTDLLELSRERGDDLTIDDVDNIIYSMAIASHETTASSILCSIVRLMHQREAWNKLCQNPDLVPGAIEELLRLSPALIAHRRRATTDTVLAGVEIPKDATIVMLLGSANHDETKFNDAGTIDFERVNTKDHLTFGLGPHYCLGAPLARFEFELLLRELVQRVPQMRLASNREIAYTRTYNLRCPASLPVRLSKTDS